MAKDITLKNGDGSVIYYPKTVSDLVFENETGKTIKQQINETNTNLEVGVGTNIGDIYTLKKIMQDGSVETATGSTNRTRQVDVENYVGQQVTIGGVLYAKTATYTYCWWAIHDENGSVIEHSNISTTSSAIRYEKVTLTIPEGAKTLYVQGSLNFMPYAIVYDKIKERISKLEYDSVKTINDLDVSSLPRVRHALISSGGTWISWSEQLRDGVLIDVQPNDKIRIVAGNESCQYSFLTEHPSSVGAGVTAPLVPGTLRYFITAGKSEVIEIPQDCYCLNIRTTYNDVDMAPVAITFIGDRFEVIENDLSNVEGEVEEIKDNVEIKYNNIVNSPDATLARFISNNTGTWNTTNLGQVASHIFYVKGGETYEVQANPNKPAYVHLLTEVDITTPPQYMDGTEKVVIPTGEKAIVNIPQDGFMLIVREFYSAGSGDYIPTSVVKVSEVNDVAKDSQERLENISFVPIRYTMISNKKISSDGSVVDVTSTANRTLKADITDYIGKTLYLTGALYKKTDTNDYCWYVFQDEEGNVIEKSETSYKASSILYKDEPIVVPEGAVFLYVQGSNAANLIMPNAQIFVNDALVEVINNGSDSVEKTTRTFALDFPCLNGNTGRIVTASTATNKFNKHTFEYIKVHKTIKIKNLGGITQNVSVYFYDKDLGFISYTSYPASEGLNELEVTDIPSGTVWFRVSFYLHNNNVATTDGYKRFEVDIESEWGYGVETTKEPYIEYQPFVYSVKANIPIKITQYSYTTKSVYGFDEGLIHLPPTYTPNGKPTPVIFFIHGDAERYTIGESSFSGHMQMQQCWSDAGFAQVDLDLIPNFYNQPTITSSGGTRDDLECLSAAWKWLTNHFNVDASGFYLIGRSRGGQCVFEVLGKGGATKLPIIAAISMAGANSMMAYTLFSNKVRTEAMWQMWCNSRGLPTENRPSWEQSPIYSTSGRWLNDTDIYNFVSNNFDLWSKKELTGWGMITKNTNNITPRDWFDNYMVPLCQSNGSVTTTMEQFMLGMKNTMEAKSPIPLRLDWCVGDTTQTKEYFVSTPHSYSSIFAEILLSTPASLTEYRRWPGVDAENPYGETNPHYAENMIFYDGDLVLPNGNVTHNPSKVTMEWMVWCMGKDPRFQGIEYTLPWQ